MSNCRGSRAVLLTMILAGCGRTPAPPIDTGSKEAVRSYFEGLIHENWQQAYAALHPDCQKRCSPRHFAHLGVAYRKNLGFEPEKLHIRSCQEHAAEAIAHVVLLGRKSSRTTRYSEGIVLRQLDGAWKVMLPERFGQVGP